jgi:hypothetical protein
MKGNRRSRPSKPRRPTEPKWSGSLTLLIIDEGPIRAAAFKAYEKAEKQVAKARDELEAFETRDLPAFARWEAQVFGPLMTELRDVTSALEEKNHLLALIEEERFWTNCSRVVAYRRVMEAKNNPSPPPTGPEFDPDFEPSHSGNHSIPGVFGESDLPPGFDIDKYDRLSRRDKKEIYEFYEDAALLYEMIHGVEAPQFDDLLEQERNRRHGRKADEPPPLEHHIPAAPPPPPGRDWNRVKELYRTLVRRLHPDLGGAQTVRERDLWQQVQDAYKARDLEWLESVAGRLDAVHQGGASLSIQILRRMTADLLSALRGLRSQLSKHRRHPAWNFHERTAALARFEANRRQELEIELATLRYQLTRVEKEINDLAGKAARPSKSKKKPAVARAQQEFFPF